MLENDVGNTTVNLGQDLYYKIDFEILVMITAFTLEDVLPNNVVLIIQQMFFHSSRCNAYLRSDY
jgi:hypothetical protein